MFLLFSVVALLIETRFVFLKTDEVSPAKKKVLPKILRKNHSKFDQNSPENKQKIVLPLPSEYFDNTPM